MKHKIFHFLFLLPILILCVGCVTPTPEPWQRPTPAATATATLTPLPELVIPLTTATPAVTQNNLAQWLTSQEQFVTFGQLWQAAGLSNSLRSPLGYTFFVPTNTALAAVVDSATLTNWQNNPTDPTLSNWLLAHVVEGRFNLEALNSLAQLPTLAGSELTLVVNDNGLLLNGRVRLATSQESVAEGLVYGVEGGLVAPAALNQPAVLPSIGQLLEQDGQFGDLLSALESAGLKEILNNPNSGPYTLFAPTDEAFRSLPAETITALQNDPTALRDLLLNHLAQGQFAAAYLLQQGSLPAQSGATITFRQDNLGIWVNNSIQLTNSDIPASNGYIMVLDRVIQAP